MDGNDDLTPSEAARERRRDRDMDSQARAGMKTGLAKQFKQVLDAQVKRAKSGPPAHTNDPTGPTSTAESRKPGRVR